MEEQCSLLGMRWRPSIFVLGGELQIQPLLWDREISFFLHPSTQAPPSFLLANICIVALQAGPANIFPHISLHLYILHSETEYWLFGTAQVKTSIKEKKNHEESANKARPIK
ncbi:receptor like protein 19 [Prunus dulcis]|uniref:Receptor like protein 19 n=1 Tax=Prunus dulcis TaxID=3755 RepID=A0A4Y1S0L2_PRUDU|nr:receptor like protein 19 [Prunus dulcis]